jgi:hypothetical protein
VLLSEKDISGIGETYLSDFTTSMQNIEAIKANMAAA